MNDFMKQKGETIVEVMLAIVVIASVVGGAFAIANRSNTTIQTNKERYQAQLYANGQADALKIFASLPINKANLDARPVDSLFCLGLNDETPRNYAIYDSTNGKCRKIVGGANYIISIEQTGAASGTYVISISWDSLINKNGDRVQLVYGI